jgi:DNA recombination protein RmuC
MAGKSYSIGLSGYWRRFSMQLTADLILFLLGLLLGGAGAWFVATVRQLAQQSKLQAQIAELDANLRNERQMASEKLNLLDEAQTKLSAAFKALSSDALRDNNQSFLDLARTSFEKLQELAQHDLEKRRESIESLVRPVQDSLGKLQQNIVEIEIKREGAYQTFNQQVGSLIQGQDLLRTEAAHLVRALGTPHVRGIWGEMQLKRVVEFAGMVNYCDFDEQQQVNTEEGRYRPDMVVRLPNNKNVVVDAKTPLEAYLEAIETDDEPTRRAKLQDHARQIREHIKFLAQKAYQNQFEPSPEFTVLFLPGESFFSAALEQDPGLIEQGVEQKVILATPTTLIALLKAVAYGWRQEELALNAKEISDLGRELYKRVATLGEHFAQLGIDLNAAIKSYNKAVGSLESRVLVTARRFKELQAADGKQDIAVLSPVEKDLQSLKAPEIVIDPINRDAQAEGIQLVPGNRKA